MFDDPKKELKRLQEQLLAAEEEQWAEPGEPEDVLEEEEEPGSLQEEIPSEEEAEQTPETSRVPALLAMLLLEVAALFGVLAWWLLWR